LRAVDNEYTLPASLLFRKQLLRTPGVVTRWQHLDWFLSMVVAAVDEIHGDGDAASEKDVITMWELLRIFVMPAVQHDVQLLRHDPGGAETAHMLVAHYRELLLRHGKCEGLCNPAGETCAHALHNAIN